MKSIVLILITLLLSMHSISQISKNNWLLSGSASFAMEDYSSSVTLIRKQTDIQISPSVGYFIFDKFATGLRPAFTYGKYKSGASSSSARVFSIGPFARYYFLNSDGPFNLFAEGSYAYGIISSDGYRFNQNTFSFLAGPVLYFNTAVGLEFTVGYATTRYDNYNGSNNALRFGIGFQFHLEKEE